MAILFTKALYRKTTHSFFDTDVNNFGDTFLYKFTFYMNYGDSAEDKLLIFRSFPERETPDEPEKRRK